MATQLTETALLMLFTTWTVIHQRRELNMKCADKDLLLYAVTDRYWLGERTLHDVVKESLDGGVTFVQLREKHLDQAHFLEEAKDLKMLCKAYNVPFVINDNVDIALEMDADGVHVGQSDMEREVREIAFDSSKIFFIENLTARTSSIPI